MSVYHAVLVFFLGLGIFSVGYWAGWTEHRNEMNRRRTGR